MKISSLCYFLVLLFFFTLIGHAAQEDEIEPLPAGLNTNRIGYSQTNQAFQILHNFSESIYNSKKISIIDDQNWQEEIETWGPGSWGRGYFTTYVDVSMYNSGGGNGNYSNWHSLPNEGKYWSSHPLVRDTGRRISAYIHKYTSNDANSLYADRIKSGIKYLLNQQFQSSLWIDGGYVFWAARPSLNTANFNDSRGYTDTSGSTDPKNQIITYSTYNALCGLCEGYRFIKGTGAVSFGPGYTGQDVLQAIENAGDFLIDWYQHCNKWENVNYRAFGLEGLAYAYIVTRKSRFLTTALEFENGQKFNFLQDDGAWINVNYTGNDNASIKKRYHDTQPHYTGIILRALVRLWDAIPQNNPAARDRVRDKIILTINHFLVAGNAKNSSGPRLLTNGVIAQYKDSPYNNNQSGYYMVEALCEIFRTGLIHTFNAADQDKIKGFLNSIMRPVVSLANNGTIHHTVHNNSMRSIALYHRTPLNSPPPTYTEPSVPTLRSPSDNAVNISRNPTLEWNFCSNLWEDAGRKIGAYRVYFGKTNPPTEIGFFRELQLPGEGRTYKPARILPSDTVTPLDANTHYYWQIEAIGSDENNYDENYKNTKLGPVWKFRTESAPGTPDLPVPSSGQSGISRNPKLEWGFCSGAADYIVYFGTSSNPPRQGSFKDLEDNVNGRYYHPGALLANKTYYWRIEAVKSDYNTAMGPVWTFQTESGPGTPDSPVPSNDSSNISLNPKLEWGFCSGATDYIVYFGTSSNPPEIGSFRDLEDNVNGRYYHPGPLVPGETYFWRIKAVKSENNTTMGPVWKFETGNQ